MEYNPYKVLQMLAKTNSLKEKKQILKDNETDLLKDILYWALNPYITYGVKKFEYAEEICNHQEGFEYNWLKAKHLLEKLSNREYTGNLALEKIKEVSQHLNYHQLEVLTRIIIKDLRCGLGIKTVNSVYGKNFIPEFNVQLASKLEGNIKFPVLAEPKLDGIRCLAFIQNGQVTYYSRNGKEFENFGCFDEELLKLVGNKNVVLDGEVTGVDNETAFKKITQQARRKYDVDNKDIVYNVFDIISLKYFKMQKCKKIQKERVAQLYELFEDKKFDKIKRVQGKTIKSQNKLDKFYNKCLKQGYEGIIIKKLDALYEYKRTKNWFKIKPTDTIDVPIVDIIEGTGKYKGMLGAFVVDVDNVQVHVGSGLLDKQRKKYWKQRKKLIGKIIEVKYDIKTEDGSLRFPRFVTIREDKS